MGHLLPIYSEKALYSEGAGIARRGDKAGDIHRWLSRHTERMVDWMEVR